ncbi:hypothetical protein PFISCL1PPCAC_5937, partial [Pristionchus fissidentatus]
VIQMSIIWTGLAGAAAAFSGAVFYANLPTRWTIGHVVPAVNHLMAAKVIKIDKEDSIDRTKIISGEEFLSKPSMVMAVRRPGCILCRREAAHLSELKGLLDEAGVRLVAVSYQLKGVDEFKPYFKGDVYLDTERTFYGPNERWMPVWMGMLRPRLWTSVSASKKEGLTGNMEGEGRLLGGVFFVDKGEMVWAHMEKEWGDKADVEEAKKAIQKYIEMRRSRL